MTPKTTGWTKRFVSLLLLTLLLLATELVLSAESRPDCRICGMWIDQNLNTRHILTTKDGTKIMFCSQTCAAKYLKGHQGEIKLIQVADYLTTELVEANDAFYLLGSDVPPVMSYTSIISFASRETAENFQKSHGGKIMSFEEVMAQQQ